MVNKDEIRKEIVERSKEVFTLYGYKKTNLDDIAVSIGKKKSSLYYYFESKEDIFRALIDYESKILLKELTEKIKNELSPIDQIKVYIIYRYKKLSEIIKQYNVMQNDFLNYIQLVYKVREKYDQLEINLLDSILADGIDKSIFSCENTMLTAKAIHIALKGIQMPFITSPVPSDMDRQLNEVINVIFYGIVKKI